MKLGKKTNKVVNIDRNTRRQLETIAVKDYRLQDIRKALKTPKGRPIPWHEAIAIRHALLKDEGIATQRQRRRVA